MIIKRLELPKESITLTIEPNGWVYKVTSKDCAVLLDGVSAENEKKVLYLCDRRDPTCEMCDDICNSTQNVEHACGFERIYDTYADVRIRDKYICDCKVKA